MGNDMPGRVNILGVGISAVNLPMTIRQMGSWIEKGARNYVNICTVHTVMECQRNTELRSIVNRSGLSTPDGMPLVWICRLSEYKDVSQVCGSDVMQHFCEYSITKGYRHYFYGGEREVAKNLAIEMQARYPGLKVVGNHTPPFRPIGTMEESVVIEKINSAKPDVIWVGLGTPKQDFWVAQHRSLLDAAILVAVGAAFDFHTGRIPRAPNWMQRYGLEWLFRFWQDPRRLWYRYLVYNPLFMLLLLGQVSGIRHYYLE
jgi:N-acetylglucosaminyldiphosphoundecaprenol N-acetyl-beta-D-mannosaminyltransferase